MRARKDERVRRLEYIKKEIKRYLVGPRQVKSENFCDGDIDESPVETVNRGGEVAEKVGDSQARHLFI